MLPGLLAANLAQGCGVYAVGEAEVVAVHLVPVGPPLVAVHHQYAPAHPPHVKCGGQTRRSASDDNAIIYFAVQLSLAQSYTSGLLHAWAVKQETYPQGRGFHFNQNERLQALIFIEEKGLS